MTVKEFFKGKAFKCIIALLCVLLISGIFLTIMNSLLAVTDQERFDRAIKKIYGKAVKTEAVAVADYNSNATIEEAYKIKDDGNYLVKATGKGGFDNGTVTCWIVVKVNKGAVGGIEKVVIDSNSGQSYISYINDKFMAGFYGEYTAGQYFNPNEGFIKTGATRSATAICNAVNAALDYVNALFGNVTVDIYENCSYIENIDTRNTSHEATEEQVTFSIKTKGFNKAGEFSINVTVDKNGVITAYAITTDGSTAGYGKNIHPAIKDGTLFVGKNLAGIEAILDDGIVYPGDNAGTEISTDASQSNFLCLSAAAFAAANYEQFLTVEETPDDNEEGGNENE